MGLFTDVGRKLGFSDQEIMSILSLKYYGVIIDMEGTNPNDMSPLEIKMSLPEKGIEPYETSEKLIELVKTTFYALHHTCGDRAQLLVGEEMFDNMVKSRYKFYAKIRQGDIWTEEKANFILNAIISAQ